MQYFIILLIFIALHYANRVGSYRTNKGILYLSKSSKCIAISRRYLRQYNRASIINTRSQRGVSYYSNLKMVNTDVDSDNDTTTEEDEIEDDSDAQTEAESASFGDDDINIADIQNMINEMENSTNSTVIEEDSEENRRSAAIKEYELKLQKEITDLENILRAERLNLGRIKDRISESGKSGFFMVQAQVNDFQRKRDLEQKNRVTRNKREFVEKMLPVVDAFRKSREQAPPKTEREENMHKSFSSLLTGILNVFDKYGFKEFTPDVGSPLSPGKHQIVEAREVEVDGGLILECVRSGLLDSEGEVLRPALVIASKVKEPVVAEPAPAAVENTVAVDVNADTEDTVDS